MKILHDDWWLGGWPRYLILGVCIVACLAIPGTIIIMAEEKLRTKRKRTIRAVAEQHVYFENMYELDSIVEDIRRAVLSQLPEMYRVELTKWAKGLK